MPSRQRYGVLALFVLGAGAALTFACAGGSTSPSAAQGGAVNGGSSATNGGSSGSGGNPALGGDAGEGGDSIANSGGGGVISLPNPARGAAFSFAPSTRTLAPIAVATTKGTIVDASNVLSGKPTQIVGNGSYLVLDFGKEVGGIVTLTFSAASDASQSAGLAFSESSLYWGPSSDHSNGGNQEDGAIFASVAGATTYTVPKAKLRGGFRYLTVFLQSTGSVTLDQVSLDFSPDPARAIPSAYPNYFYCNDDLLNKAWYAGAYTFQTNLARVNEGRVWPAVAGWDNSATVGTLGDVVLVDGAKRDRLVWPGDMGISLPTGYVSLFDTVSAKNSLQTLFDHQAANGVLPFAGPPVNAGGSDTYHLWTLYGAALYFEYSADKAWVDSIWSKYKAALAYSTGEIGTDGLLSVPAGQSNDWARDNTTGETLEANALLYGVLTKSAELAAAEGDSALAKTYTSAAASLQNAINGKLWDSTGAYKDNPTSTLHPQDGNSLAVWFGVADSAAKKGSISSVLNENWNDKGARGPEFTRGTGAPLISTFASSMELMSHFEAGADKRGLDMIRSLWGFMLSAPTGTGSTFWEGFKPDGSFAYDGSYTSLAHGWGTGPTSALTLYVLGAAADSAGGKAYHVAPHPGDLTHVEGNLTLATGQVLGVSYDVGAACSSFALRVDASTLSGSVGRITMPTYGATHEIFVDGVLAWDRTQLITMVGDGAATTNATSVTFTGIGPGVHTFVYTDGTECPEPAEEWTFCADEGATCAFTGTQRVRFGKYGNYSYGIFTGGTPCNTTALPDPAKGVAKSCAVSSELYTACANEGGTCTVTGTKEVRYGANGQWKKRMITGSTPCDTTTFGDPLPYVGKRCEWR